MTKKVVLENMTTILLVALIAMTLLWFVLLYESLQEYLRYGELWYRWASLEMQRIYEESGVRVDFFLSRGYFEVYESKIIVAMGFVLLCSWVLIAREKWLDFRASRRV